MNNPYIIEKLKEKAMLDRISKLETKVAQLEVLAKQEDNFPQEDDMFWFIDTFGKPVGSTWGESITNRQLIEIGNMFRTKEQAEFEVEKLKVLVELRKFSVPFKRGGNYTFNYYHEDEKIVNVYASGDYQEIGTLYFESNEEMNRAIQTVGEERIKKYIFGV